MEALGELERRVGVLLAAYTRSLAALERCMVWTLRVVPLGVSVGFVIGAEIVEATDGRLTGTGGPAETLSYGTERRSWLEREDCRKRDFFLPKSVSIGRGVLVVVTVKWWQGWPLNQEDDEYLLLWLALMVALSIKQCTPLSTTSTVSYHYRSTLVTSDPLNPIAIPSSLSRVFHTSFSQTSSSFYIIPSSLTSGVPSRPTLGFPTVPPPAFISAMYAGPGASPLFSALSCGQTSCSVRLNGPQSCSNAPEQHP